MKAEKYFKNMTGVAKKYEVMRAFFKEKMTAEEVAIKFGYTVNTVYSLTKQFRKQLQKDPRKDPFFKEEKKGRPYKKERSGLKLLIVSLRKKNLSVPDIKAIIDTQPSLNASESYIDYVLKQEGFLRLPRRAQKDRGLKELPEKQIEAEKSRALDFIPERFSSSDIGVLCFLPILKKYGIEKAIQETKYPYTKIINKKASILSFLALKLSNIRRYTKDNLWCMDRGQGLFAGLNVLPKAAWFTSYSSRVTRDMNLTFLKKMHEIWKKEGFLGDTTNLDFTTIPYWGENAHLENNWSGKRNKALASMSAILAQDSDSGIISYSDTNVMHKNQKDIVLEFLDFYKDEGSQKIDYLVFDSKFTCYQNLERLDKDGIKFLTIRRRGKNIVEKLNNISPKKYKKIRVDCAGNKKRTLKVLDEIITLKGYAKDIRQIAITGHGKIKPALIITNDFDEKTEIIIRKYTRRWLVEKGISEQIEFFHLNRVSSSMVIKVDFDLTMSITAHNIYRLFAKQLNRYQNFSDQTIYEDFIKNSGEVVISENTVQVFLKKKRSLPKILSVLTNFSEMQYPLLDNKKLLFLGASST